MMFDPALTTVVLRQHVAAVSSSLRRRARRLGIRGALKSGSVAVIQRFSSALGASPHFHTLFELRTTTDGKRREPVGRIVESETDRLKPAMSIDGQLLDLRSAGAPPH